MRAQWDSSLSSLWPGFNSQPRRSISRDFSLADHTLPTHPEPARQKIAQSPFNDTTQPVDSEEKGRSPTTDRRWLTEKKDLVLCGMGLLYLTSLSEFNEGESKK